MGLEYAHPILYPGNRETQPEFYEHDAEVIAGWGANLIRVNFAADWYLENTENYRDYVRQWVEACTSRGMNVIMDCHYPTRMSAIIFPDNTEAEANVIVEPMIQALEQAASDFISNDRVIGVEINEPWCMDGNPTKQWPWLLNMNNRLAQRVHVINPNLLVFIDIGSPEWTADQTIIDSVGILTEPNMVLAPHVYLAEVGFPYHGKHYPNDGGDFFTYYQAGDYVEAKNRLYLFLDTYYKSIQDIYGLPVVVTEFAGKRDLLQPLVDLMEYFNTHGWGYSYWTYFGTYDTAMADALLESDWTTLSPTGHVFVEGLQGH